MTVEDVEVIWHEAECGAYAADLSLWEDLAAEASGPVLELGCGSGRVSLHLARRGHSVLGIDVSDALVGAMNRRAGELPAEASVADAADFDLGRAFNLVLAPMLLLQLIPTAEERLRCIGCVAAHLAPGGLAAFALVEQLPAAREAPPLRPDTREVDGHAYSSLPLETEVGDDAIVIRRLRQVLSPTGDLSEELNEVRLLPLSATGLAEEAEQAGLRPAGHRLIAETSEHVGSTVVLLEVR